MKAQPLYIDYFTNLINSNEKRRIISSRYKMAGGEGVEPPHTDSESAVLPLDEPPKLVLILPDDLPPYKSNFMLPAVSYPCACGCFPPVQFQGAR